MKRKRIILISILLISCLAVNLFAGATDSSVQTQLNDFSINPASNLISAGETIGESEIGEEMVTPRSISILCVHI